MTQEALDIVVKESGAKVVKRNVDDIGTSAKNVGKEINTLNTVLAALGSVLAVNKLMEYADAWERVSGFVRVATKSTSEAIIVQKELFDIAQRTRQPLTEMAELYSRIIRAQATLGTSQSKVLQSTELVGKALAAQGANGEATRKVLIQLGQALGGGIVRGEEYNAMAENLPYILTVVAQHVKGVDGNVSALRNKMLAGTLTSKEFFDAILAGADQIETDFLKAPRTFAQGFAIMNNAVMRYIGEVNAAYGLSRKFGELALVVSNNIKSIGSAIVGVSVALTLAFSPLIITKFIAAITPLWALLAAHPIMLVVGAIAGLITYLTMMDDQLKIGIDDFTTWSDLISGVADEIKATFVGTSEVVATENKKITSSVKAETSLWSQMFGDTFGTIEGGMLGLIRVVAITMDAIAGYLTGLAKAFLVPFKDLGKIAQNSFKEVINAVGSGTETILNTMIEMSNKVRSTVGMEPIELVKFKPLKVDEVTIKSFSQDVRDAFDRGFAEQGGYMEKKLDNALSRAQQKSSLKKYSRAGAGGASLDSALPAEALPSKASKEVNKLNNALRQLLDTIYPSAGALLEMAKAEDTLAKAAAKGLITQEQRIKYMGLLKQHYQDIVDPIGAVLREQDKEISLIGKSVEERAIETEYRQIEQDLLKKGIDLKLKENSTTAASIRAKIEERKAREGFEIVKKWHDDLEQEVALLGLGVEAREKETMWLEISKKAREGGLNILEKEAQIREHIDALISARKTSGIRDELISGSSEKQLENFRLQLEEISKLKESGSFGQNEIASKVLGMTGNLFEGTDLALQAQEEKFSLMYAQIDALRQNDLVTEEQASQARLRIWSMEQEAKTSVASQFFGNLASLQSSSDSRLAAIGKAAAISQALINVYVGGTKALAQGGIYGAFMMASVIATGLATVAQIRSAGSGGNYGTSGYLTGGSFTVGGSGGDDSQMVAFRATPGERVAISTPTQERKGNPNESQGGANVQVPIKIVNVLDPETVTAAMSSSSGERIILNTIEKYPNQVRKMIGG